MDDFYWKPDSGVRLDAGPLLTKEYDPAALACEFWNDFIGPCNWLWSLAGVGETTADGAGKLLRLASLTGNGDKESLTSGDGALLRVIPLEGISESESETGGLLNTSVILTGDSNQQSSGAAALQEIRLLEGTSQVVSAWRNVYCWLLSQGLPFDQGPPLDKQYSLGDPAHVFWDDFLGRHRYLILRLRAAAGESSVKTINEGAITLLWNLIGSSCAETSGAGNLSLMWDLTGSSIALIDGAGTLTLLWRLIGDSVVVADSQGRPLRLRQVAGDSITLTAGEGKVIKWPLSIEIGVEHLGIEGSNYIGSVVRLTAEFCNADGGPEDPGDVYLRIYDGRKKIVAEFLVRPYAVGKYRRDYTVPGEPLGPLMFEYSGELGGKAKLARARLERVWE